MIDYRCYEAGTWREYDTIEKEEERLQEDPEGASSHRGIWWDERKK